MEVEMSEIVKVRKQALIDALNSHWKAAYFAGIIHASCVWTFIAICILIFG